MKTSKDTITECRMSSSGDCCILEECPLYKRCFLDKEEIQSKEHKEICPKCNSAILAKEYFTDRRIRRRCKCGYEGLKEKQKEEST